MSRVSTCWRWFLGIAISSLNALSASYANAQIIPDATLPINSNVRVQGGVFNITGGTQAGSNLFHSFQQFSVPTGNAAFFNNAVNIQNIISRVTGGSVSNIDGLLRANGTANLFLINPNGIVFGPNAALNVGGSLAVSTANAIQFGEQGFFSATQPNSPPLLTVNPSAFFFNQITPGNIVVQGQTGGVSNVAAGRSLVLLGGNILVDGGTLNAQGGRVELGGLAKAGTVQINFDNNNLSLAFPRQVERADIQLSNGAIVNVSAGDGGTIAINARNLQLTGGSNLFVGIGNSLGTVDTQAGDITINTTGSIALTDNSAIASIVESDAIGNSGNINIKTGSLSLDNNSGLFANTNGRGNAANIFIAADDSVNLANNSFIFNGVGPGGIGNGGNISIQAGSLAVINGSQISSSVDGQGDAGNINIDVLDNVSLAGVGNDGFLTGVFSNVGLTAVGNGGNITFRTGRLQVRDGAQVSTGTFGLGDAGNLSVETLGNVELIGTSPDGRFASGFTTSVFPVGRGNGGDLRFISGGRLLIKDGAQVSTATFGQGDAGNLNFIARDAVELVGTSPNGIFPSRVTSAVEEGGLGNGGDLRFTTPRLQIRDGAQISTATSGRGNAGNLLVRAIDAELIGTSPDGKFASGFTSAVEPGGVGNGGSLIIDANRLRIANGAIASASSLGTGDPGSINAQADFIILDQGQLTAQSITSRGGDIRLITDLLLLRNSLLSTTFAIPQLVGNEEVSIAIDTGFLVALDNSNIIANAFAGLGANFTVNAQALVISPDSSIVVNGEQIEVPPIVELLTELPIGELIDSSTQITSSCGAFGKGGSEFTVTGRGGLPPSPDDFLSGDVVWSDTRLTATASQQQPKKPAAKPRSKVETFRRNVSTVAIVPATGWVFNGKGEVTLISDAANADSSSYTPATCLGH